MYESVTEPDPSKSTGNAARTNDNVICTVVCVLLERRYGIQTMHIRN